MFSSKTPLRNQEGKIVGLATTNRLYRDVMGDDDELTKLLPAVDRMTKHYEQKIGPSGFIVGKPGMVDFSRHGGGVRMICMSNWDWVA